MKKLTTILLITTTLMGCRGCFASYEQRRTGVQKVCSGCIYTVSENMHIAQDTSKNPNVIYRVSFKNGGMYFNAWDVDHLTRLQ